jgi:hypothetical protein
VWQTAKRGDPVLKSGGPGPGYEIKRDGDVIAPVSKRWFRLRETYGIEIQPGEDGTGGGPTGEQALVWGKVAAHRSIGAT